MNVRTISILCKSGYSTLSGVRALFLIMLIICVFGLTGITHVVAIGSSAETPMVVPQKGQTSDSIEIIKDIEIGKAGTRVLHADIARPKMLPGQPMPAVMWIHGGAWSSGSHHDFQQTVQLAKHGYLVISVEYRLIDEAIWPAQIEDCKLGVRWLRENAAKYNVNPDRIGCWGTSAGGHLAALMGVTGDKPDMEGNSGSAGFSSRVQAVVDFCGPTVFDGRPETYSSFTTKMAGGTYEQKPEVFRRMSPLENVSPKACPFLIVNGEKDMTVPLFHAQLMTEALRKANVPVELIIVKNAGHGYTFVAPKGDPPAQPSPAEVDAAVLKFLDANLKTESLVPQKLAIVLNPGDLNFLKAPLAEYTASLRESSPRGFWVQGWNKPEQFFRWSLTSPSAGNYVVEVLISGEPGSSIEIIGPLNRLILTLPAGNDHWGNNWNRLRVPGTLSLPGGTSSITVRSQAPKGISTARLNGMALLSLELATAEARKELDHRVQKFRSGAKWFANAKYGVFLQWGEWGYPQHGEKKKWPQMIDDFDVEKFASTMHEIGAGYVIWSATWRTHYFPAPIKAVDDVLPGRTSKRDLIGDLISALGKRGIKLILYYHCGRGDKEWQARNWSNDDPDNWGMDPAFRKHWGDIITEVGQRYGKGLAGWLDDEGEYPKPYEEIGRQLKAGNPNRIISINDWVRPRLTEFQDYQFGEGFTGLNNGAGIRYPYGPERGGNGIYKEGPHKGLQAHGTFVLDGPDWGVFRPETIIRPPQFTNEQLTSIVEEAVARKIVLSFCLLMYEDGTFSEKSLEAMRYVKKVARVK
jgi:acetyl esterase/lipase